MRLRARTTAALALALIVAAFGVGACGDDDDADDGAAVTDDGGAVVRACSSEPPISEDWTGDPRGGIGIGADVADFNDYLASAPAPVSTSPCDAAGVFLHLDRPQDQGASVDVVPEPEESATATVTVTLDDLPDDSVAAQRWTLEFEPAEGDAIRLADATVAYRCQPGRGQQEFAVGLCV